MSLRLRVFDGADLEKPVDPPDVSALVEIRSVSGEGASMRFTDWERLREGVYETAYVPTRVGELEIVVLLDLEERSSLPPESTDRVSVIVETSSETAGAGSDMTGVVVAVVLVAVVGLGVAVATRERARVPQRPFPNYTWWNSP